MANGTCRISNADCSKPGGKMTGGLCLAHYKRLLKYGDPLGFAWNERPADLPGEIWRPVLDWESLYETSNLARIWSLNKPGHPGRILKPFTSGDFGYLAVKLCRDGAGVTVYVHRAVADTFLGRLPGGWQTRHGKGGPQDNRLANLSQGTPEDNGQDKLRDGTSRPGSECHFAVLTEADVIDIRHRVAAGERQKSAAERYGITQSSVSQMVARKTWRNC